jgi:hypothetical protein
MDKITLFSEVCNPHPSPKLFAHPDLTHIRLVVPVQGFFDHYPILPMAHRTHRQFKRFARWRRKLAIAQGHWFGKGSLHHPGYASPFSRAVSKAYRVDFYPRIRGVNK